MDDRVGVVSVIVATLLLGTSPVTATAMATPLDAGVERPQLDSSSEPFAQSSSGMVTQDGIDADEVHMNVAIRSDGTAEWTLEFWVRLEDEESATAFDSLQEDIRTDPDNYTRPFADRMRDTVAAASDATGREMSADGFSVETERRSFAREYGVVRYTFQWHGFAAVDGDELRAGDAVEGLFLDDGTRLLLEWPAEYELQSASPEPDERRENAVLWRGSDTDFVSGEPALVVTAGPGLGPGFDRTTLAAVALVVAGFVAGAWRYRARLQRGLPSVTADASATATTDSAEEAQESESNAVDADSDPDADPNPDPIPDRELLSNEEQVLRVVREHGGRVKQQTVVEELGWTDAKTSKVVSGLREEGELESFRLGRENVLSLPDDESESEPERATANGGDGSR